MVDLLEFVYHYWSGVSALENLTQPKAGVQDDSSLVPCSKVMPLQS